MKSDKFASVFILGCQAILANSLKLPPESKEASMHGKFQCTAYDSCPVLGGSVGETNIDYNRTDLCPRGDNIPSFCHFSSQMLDRTIIRVMKRRWGKTFDTSFYSKFLPRYLCNTDIESSVEIEKYSFFSVSSGAIAFHEDEQYRERLGETTITIHMN